MRFFLVGTDRESRTLRLVTDEVFDSRRDALAHLSAVGAAASVAGPDEEVFVVDLDTAAPVLVVAPAPEAAPAHPAGHGPEPQAEQRSEPVEEPIAEAVLADAGIEEQAEAEAPEAEPVEEPTAEADVPVMADYPTPYVPEPAAWPWGSAESGEPEAVDEVAVTEVEVEAAIETEPETAADLVAAEPEAEAFVVEEEVPLAPALDPLEEPAVDDVSLLPAVDETAIPGRTVVMGEYAEDGAAVEAVPDYETETETAEAEAAIVRGFDVPVSPMSAREPVQTPAVADGEITSAEPEAVEPEDGEVVEVESVGVSEEGEAPAEQVPTDTFAPAPADAAPPEPVPDISEYDCDDCVYVNTCPKHHESDPSTCGSFQWKTA